MQVMIDFWEGFELIKKVDKEVKNWSLIDMCRPSRVNQWIFMLTPGSHMHNEVGEH